MALDRRRAPRLRLSRRLALVVVLLAAFALVACAVVLAELVGVPIESTWAIAITTASGFAAIAGAVKLTVELARFVRSRMTEPVESEFARTPRLGLQFWQDGKLATMRWCEALSEQRGEVVRITLTAKPFTLRMPRYTGNPAVQVCAWTDNSIFCLEDYSYLSEVPFFAGGTGVADYEYGSSRLVISNSVHNYLAGDRIRRKGNGVDEVFYSRLALRSGDILLGDYHGLVYLSIYVNRNGGMLVHPGDYEYLVLDFR